MGRSAALRVLDLDGSLTDQPPVRERLADGRATLLELRPLGSALRLWSSGRTWTRLEGRLAGHEAGAGGKMPLLTLVGSGDFHHVSAALIRRAPGPLTVLHFDNHPDWCRSFPARHCGAWVRMALAMEHVRRVVTVGPCSDDLDRPDRKRAGLDALSEGRHQVFAWNRPPTAVGRRVDDGPGHRCRDGRIAWRNIGQEDFTAFFARVLDTLPTRGVWITIDKDVLAPGDALTNWDQGRMPLGRLLEAIRMIASRRRIVGADICGDFAPFGHRHPMKLAESMLDQPRRPSAATLAWGLARNAETNRALIETFEALA